MKYLKKHLWVITSILCLPIAINFILLIPSFTPIVGNNVEWLSFWANYISANVAFIILYIQRKDNKKENDNNRKLQINILRHQQEMQWLNMFRQVSVEYVSAYTYNDLVHAINVMRKNPEDAFNILGQLIERLAKCDTNLGYIGMRGENKEKLYSICYNLFILYYDVIDDIQKMMVYIINSKDLTFEAFCIDSGELEVSNEMKDIITLIATQKELNMAQSFNNVAMNRIKIIEKRAAEIRDIFASYIVAEEKRIDNILTENL